MGPKKTAAHSNMGPHSRSFILGVLINARNVDATAAVSNDLPIARSPDGFYFHHLS
jgi:hypothetical protein